MLPALLGIETWLLSLCCSQSCPLNHFAIHGRFEKQPGIEDNLPLQWLSLQSAMVASRLRLFLFLVVSGPFDAESCLLVTYAELAWINFRSVSQTWWSSYPGRNYSHTCVKLRRVSIGELFSFFLELHGMCHTMSYQSYPAETNAKGRAIQMSKIHKKSCCDWPFQESKLKVPNIYI